MTFQIKSITLIVPWDNCGYCGDKTLIEKNKMEREMQRARESRHGQPSHLTEPPNVTDK